MAARRLVGRRWYLVRQEWEAMLPVPCPYCGQAVTPDQAWDLDHEQPIALGGVASDDNLRPAHARCNRRAGQHLRAAMRRARSDAGSFRAGGKPPAHFRTPPPGGQTPPTKINFPRSVPDLYQDQLEEDRRESTG